jgi:hypothetical protein
MAARAAAPEIGCMRRQIITSTVDHGDNNDALDCADGVAL